MTPADARQLLAAWRPGTADAGDPEVSQALDLARRDPELARWWTAQETFHRHAAATLRATQPPAGLADRILAARKTSRPAFVPPTRIPWWTAVAASLALAAGIWFAVRPAPAPPEDGFDTFRSRMVRAVLREYRMDVVTNDLASIRSFLSRHQAPADFELRPPLASTPPLGAGLLSWQGRPVSMVCLDGGGLGTLFLFIAPQESLRKGAPTDLQFSQVSQLATASWSRDGRTYVLAAVATPDQLRQWMETTRRDQARLDRLNWRPPAAKPSTSSCAPAASPNPRTPIQAPT